MEQDQLLKRFKQDPILLKNEEVAVTSLDEKKSYYQVVSLVSKIFHKFLTCFTKYVLSWQDISGTIF